MTLVRWNDDLRIGDPQIDADHEKLFDVLENLLQAMKQGRKDAVLRGLLHELIRQSEIHFRREEQFMLRIGYVDYDDHKSEHDRLMREIRAVQAKLVAGRHGISVGLYHFINDWLAKHIAGRDKALAAALVDSPIAA